MWCGQLNAVMSSCEQLMRSEGKMKRYHRGRNVQVRRRGQTGP